MVAHCTCRILYSCLHLSTVFQVKIELPGAKSADIELDVKSKFLDCRTPKT